jgi:hypothetical protein
MDRRGRQREGLPPKVCKGSIMTLSASDLIRCAGRTGLTWRNVLLSFRRGAEYVVCQQQQPQCRQDAAEVSYGLPCREWYSKRLN